MQAIYYRYSESARLRALLHSSPGSSQGSPGAISMKPDERALLVALASLMDVAGWASAWSVSENWDDPIHSRRIAWLVKKWDRKRYWEPLRGSAGSFTPKGWEWLASIGIQRGEPIDPEHWVYARWLANPDSPHVPDRNGYYCCIPPNYHWGQA